MNKLSLTVAISLFLTFFGSAHAEWSNTLFVPEGYEQWEHNKLECPLWNGNTMERTNYYQIVSEDPLVGQSFSVYRVKENGEAPYRAMWHEIGKEGELKLEQYFNRGQWHSWDADKPTIDTNLTIDEVNEREGIDEVSLILCQLKKEHGGK